MSLQEGTEPNQGSELPPIAAVIVLAAGAGTRMRSALPKVLHPMAGRPLIWHALRSAAAVNPQHLVAVIGHGRDQVTEFLAGADDLPAVTTAVQDQQLGTGHAVECALAETGALTGTVLVSYGDVPLLRGETLAALAADHQRAGRAVTVLTAVVDDPTGYGRIVRDSTGAVTAIIEHKDADAATRSISEINTGVYAFDGAVLTAALPRITAGNAAGERYLTDVVALAVGDGLAVGAMTAADSAETEGVNDRAQLAALGAVLRARLNHRAMLSGVTVLDPATTYLDVDVTIGDDTVIEPGTHLTRGTRIGSGCVIGPDTTLTGCEVEDGARVLRSHCADSIIRAGAQIGPYTHLRPGSDIGPGAQVGAYVEVKKATIGAGAKSHHLTYLGDATVGAHANIGAGVVTANYDGSRKYHTEIGEHAFIGTNSTLVAPVTVADGAFVAAGSTITTDVDPGDLAVARGRQRAIAGWVLRRREDSPGAAAARDALAAARSAPPDDGDTAHLRTSS